jgi:hypothetical protein
MLRRLRQRLERPIPPVLVGDFNCVIAPLDVQEAVNYADKYSAELDNIVKEKH